jgi:translation initiation factor 2B subunit (eIF-2B alpha/beta/delta family)
MFNVDVLRENSSSVLKDMTTRHVCGQGVSRLDDYIDLTRRTYSLSPESKAALIKRAQKYKRRYEKAHHAIENSQ